MVKITVNSTNRIALPLDSQATLTNPYYLFVIYSEMQNEIVKSFVSSELATASQRERANQFDVVEVGTGGTENLYAGQIRLPYNGTYLLSVYEQTSSGNITVANATGKVWTEVLKVYGNNEGSTTEYTGNDTDFTVYKFEQ
jgi:hypothetical protein